jgi:F-type H+-transporting ATPase subunit b|tara:strand:+ start:67 stop:642 length:576 start_codon:yes stop_codon:yes gene_type:complete
MRLFLILIGTFITSTVCLFAAEAGMPQLDPTYWASQAFWLILIFTLLYFALSKLFIPKIKDGIDNRENKIKDDLDEAQKLKEVAEQKLEEYEKSIIIGKKEAQKILFENKNKLNTDIQNKKKIFEKEINQELRNAEKEIEKFKENSLINISSISEEITSSIVEAISGEPINQSSVKAAVLESTKKNLGKYL